MVANPRGDAVVRVSIVLGVIDTLAVILRFMARRKSKAKIAADDWIIAASLLPAYAMIVSCGFWAARGGAGRHTDTLTPDEMTLFLKLLIPPMITYGLTVTAVRISILLLYRRIFDTVIFKRILAAVGSLCLAWLLGEICTEIFLCSPISAAWDPQLIFTDHCGNLQASILGITISSMLLDVIILCLPLPMIWKLQLPPRHKLVVCGLFLLGGLTCIVSILRIASVAHIRDEDIAYTFVYTYLWSHLEPATAIWCACIMTYRPLFVDLNLKYQTLVSRNCRDSSMAKFWFSTPSSKRSSSTGKTDSVLQLPFWRSMHSRESSKYSNVGEGGANEKSHVVHVRAAREVDNVFHGGQYECSAIAFGRETSLV